MATLDSILATLRAGYDQVLLTPFSTIQGSAQIQSGYYADPGLPYDSIDDGFVCAKLDNDPHSQLELDISPVRKHAGTGDDVDVSVTARDAFPVHFLNQKVGAGSVETLYLGFFIRVVNPRDNAQAQTSVKFEYISATTERLFGTHSGTTAGTTTNVDGSALSPIELTLTPEDGVSEAFIGPYDLKGVKSKFYSPAKLTSTYTDVEGQGRIFVDLHQAEIKVRAQQSADVTIVHCFATTPGSFAKAALVLHLGEKLADFGIMDSVVNYPLSVARSVTASDIWAMASGGVEQEGFLKSLISGV